MRLSYILFLIFSFGVALFHSGCSDKEMDKTHKIKAAVTIITYKDFVKAVGGDKVEVEVFVPKGMNPHLYQPGSGIMKKIAAADIYFKTGGGFEFERKWLAGITDASDHLIVQDCSDGVDIIINNHHMWLAPSEVKIIIRNIYEGLVKVKPDEQEYFRKNKDEYIHKIDSVKKLVYDKFDDLKSRHFMVFHPAWSYFTREIGLEQIAIEKHGKEPSAGELKEIIDRAKELGIKTVFVEPQFNKKAAESISEEIGAEIKVLDPLPENWLENMIITADKISEALKQK